MAKNSFLKHLKGSALLPFKKNDMSIGRGEKCETTFSTALLLPWICVYCLYISLALIFILVIFASCSTYKWSDKLNSFAMKA